MPKGVYERKPITEEHRANMRLGMLGKNSKPKIPKKCELCPVIFQVNQSGVERRRFCSFSCRAKYFSGEKSWHYKKDRSLLVKKQIRNDSAYGNWRKEVWSRDGFKCKIGNIFCNGRIEAHHVLVWSEYPELRYEVNNGITLCHAHHPRKRAEEKRLSPYFAELVSVSKI